MKKYVTYLKAVGIMLVVIGHINFANAAVKPWIYAFHMPLFFFAAGLTLKAGPLDFLYIKRKYERLIVPYLIWALFYSTPEPMNILKILYGSYSLICSAGALSSLWYLTCLFVSILLSKMVVSRSKNVSMIIAAACVCFLAGILLPRISYGYPFCFDIALIASAFILFGHLFEKYFISCKTIVRVLFLIIGLSVTLITPNTFDNGKYIVLANKDIGNPLFFAASAVGGCLFVYGTARIISNFAIPRFIETGLTFIGDNSLTILLVHKPFIELVQRFLPSGISPVFQLMLAFIVTMIFSAVSAKIIGLLFPFIIGKTAKASGAH